MRHWIRLSRPEFHTVGILPLLLGAMAGYRASGTFAMEALILALLATMAIMLVTYWTGEVFDYEVDALSARLEKNRFSGGTLVLQNTGLPPRRVLNAAFIVAVLTALIGLWLAWGMAYGPSLFLAGAIGAVLGFFYSTPPFRWAYRGLGEIFIGIAYGWLPVAVGWFLQTRSWDMPPILLLGAPLAVSIFMVILINEFPDFPADRQMGKRNLVVRLGRDRAARLYALAAALFILSIVLPALNGRSAMLYALPATALALANAHAMLRGDWRDAARLESLCGRTIALNLLTGVSLSIGVCLS